MNSTGKPKLAVWKFASCDGCQLSLLDCEDELLALGDVIEIAHFPEATRTSVGGPYDISLVEGSITRQSDLEALLAVRAQSRLLVTIGACATAGGIQALKNYHDAETYVSLVYAKPEYIDTLRTSTPISAHVKVDYELHGCPVNKQQLLQALLGMARGTLPNIARSSVCTECKSAGTPCLLVTTQEPCLGPVTHGGCGGLCPRYGRGCFGCFGPARPNNMVSLATLLKKHGSTDAELKRLASTFNVATEPFRELAQARTTGEAEPAPPPRERP